MLLHCKVFNVLHTVKIKIYQNIEREREREREREITFLQENTMQIMEKSDKFIVRRKK